MVSRPIIVLSLLLAASNGAMAAVSSSSSPPHYLRASSTQAAASASSSSEDIPDVTDTQSLQDSVDENATAVDANATAIDANVTAIDANATNTAEDCSTTDDEDSITVPIPADCLNFLTASANEYGALQKENYFVFTDGMSNGYYSFNNMTTYSDLPRMNKLGFVTLTCQCHAFGGRENCCHGNRAKLDVSGIDDPESLSTQMKEYFLNICSVTSDSIGENKLPPTTARPTTSIAPTSSAPPSLRPSVTIWPSKVPTEEPKKGTTPVPTRNSMSQSPSTAPPSETPSKTPTNMPTLPIIPTNNNQLLRPPPATAEPTDATTVKLIPSVEDRTGVGNINGSQSPKGGFNGRAWVGIAIAVVCLRTLMMYLLFGKNKDDETDEDNLDEMSRLNNGKELLAITANGEMDSDRPPRIESPDATNNGRVAELVSTWEAMAASAAAIVKRDESTSLIGASV